MTLETFVRRHRLQNFTFVDVGAMGALDFSAGLAPLTSLHAFEPHADACADLRTRYAVHPFKSLCINPCALGSEEGVMTFHVTRHPAMSSLLAPDHEAYRKALGRHPHYTKWQQTIRIERDTMVDVRTLDRHAGVELPIAYLKIDTQGSELQVLQGAQQLLKDRQILVVKAEASTVAVYDRQPLCEEICSFMKDSGFLLVDFVVADIGARLKAPSGDALFVLAYMKEPSHRVRAAAVLAWLGRSHAARRVAADLLSEEDWHWLAQLNETRRGNLAGQLRKRAAGWWSRFF
jgi:FkbM family methyltransferase